jgi:hypothetical protein
MKRLILLMLVCFTILLYGCGKSSIKNDAWKAAKMECQIDKLKDEADDTDDEEDEERYT